MLTDERRAEIEKWALAHFANGKHGGYHGRLSQMLVDVLHAYDELAAENAAQLRDALRAVMAVDPDQLSWCQEPISDGYLGAAACGECEGCLAWQAAHDALAACEEVSDAE